MLVRMLPSLNAILNAASAALLIMGYRAIRRGNIGRHRRFMLSAFVVSGVFLVSYLVLRYHAGVTRFVGQGWIRPVYFAILLTHTVLAAAMVPFAIATLARGLRGQFDRHRRMARWTLPIWLYVSVTGVLVYWMLYRM